MGGGTDLTTPPVGKETLARYFVPRPPPSVLHDTLWLRVGTEIEILGIPVSQVIVSLWNITIEDIVI